MTVQEIVEAYLKANGFDGLYYPGICACKVGCLMPVGCEGSDLCRAGVFVPVPEDEKADGRTFWIGEREE